MTTISVLDKDGNTVAIQLPPAPGRTSAAGSRSVALSQEDYAAIGQVHTDLDLIKIALAAATPAGGNLMGRAVADASAATGGIPTTGRFDSAAATTNATRAKASAGRVYSAQGENRAAYSVYLVLYDSAANPPVPGTTTIRKKIPIPPGAFALDWALGLSFATGIGFAFTKLPADTDTTALVAADVVAFNLDYA